LERRSSNIIKFPQVGNVVAFPKQLSAIDKQYIELEEQQKLIQEQRRLIEENLNV
jgi:hypothetical protein